MQSGLNDMDCQFVIFPMEFRHGIVSRSNFVYFRIFTVHIGQEFCTHGATAGRARTLLSGIRSISSGTIIKSLSATIYIKSDEFSSMKILVSFSTFYSSMKPLRALLTSKKTNIRLLTSDNVKQTQNMT